MSKEKLFHVGVKALMTNEKGQILILDVNGSYYDNKDAQWDLPGGRIQEGQTADEALRREVKEETGITPLTKIDFFDSVIANIEIPISKTEKVGLVLMVYKVKVPRGVNVVLNEEHVGYKWVGKREAAKKLAHKFPLEFTKKLSSE